MAIITHRIITSFIKKVSIESDSLSLLDLYFCSKVFRRVIGVKRQSHPVVSVKNQVTTSNFQ